MWMKGLWRSHRGGHFNQLDPEGLAEQPYPESPWSGLAASATSIALVHWRNCQRVSDVRGSFTGSQSAAAEGLDRLACQVPD